MECLTKNPAMAATTAACAGATLASLILLSMKEKPQQISGGGAVTPGYLARIGRALAVKFGGAKAPQHALKEHIVQLEEKGAEGKTLDKRLYMQLSVLDADNAYAGSNMESALHQALKNKKVDHIIYANIVDPTSIGVLTWSSDPSYFVDNVRPVLQQKEFYSLKYRQGWQMFGKTYTNGHEKDLEHWLLRKPLDAAFKEDNLYALWYPMRRSGKFYLLEPAEKCRLVLAHAAIGRAYGVGGHASDIRLNCFGIDGDDNEFVVGLCSHDLNALSKCVQDMRVTQHTSLYMDKLGPFFVGQRKFQFEENSTKA